ncbi:hypothetical protein MNBD_GAMMA09-1542 [hydrothermal vent metagenome]|uniref:AsmA domain-containing protein n=1 Tax=hydrothermal vent metagenome TaxID=652676 RepID=A0A3B0XGV8_9ZZZZ
MKFIKVSLLIVVGLIVVVLLVGGIFLASLNTGKYEAIAAKQVKQRTGRDLSIGEIKLSFFPWLGIELQQLSLSNATGFKPQYMVKIDSLDVHLQLMALLMQEIRVDTIRVHGLQLALGRNKKAETNWDDILQKLQSKEAQTKVRGLAVEDKKTPEEQAVSAVSILVNGVELKNAEIRWQDDTTAQTISLRQVNLITGAYQAEKPLSVSVSGNIELSELQSDIKMQLQTAVEFNAQTQQLTLDQLVLNIDTALQKMGIEQAAVTLKTGLQADLKNQIFKLPQMVLTLKASGDAIPGNKIQAEIKTAINLNLQQQTADIEKLTVNAQVNSQGIKLQGDIALKKLIDAPQIDGQLRVDEFNPATLAKKLAIELPPTQSKEALKKLAIRFDVSANEHSVQLKKINIQLDQSSLKGIVSISQFEQPAIRYQLKLDRINLDNYLPPAAASTAAGSAKVSPNRSGSVAGNVDTPIDLPVELLRSLNIQGDFSASNITAYQQAISSLNIKVQAKEGLIKLPVISAKVLDGKISALVQLDVRNQLPRYKLQTKAENVDADKLLSPMLEKMLGEKALRLAGIADLTVDVNSQGRSVNQLISNSNGQLKLNVGKATLQGVDTEYFAQKKVFRYMEKKKLPVPEEWKRDYSPKDITALKMARASAVLRNGVLNNQDLLLHASRFKVTGAGKINLLTQNIDYRMIIDVNPPRTKTVFERLLDVPMPVIIKGGGAAFKVDIDYDKWLKTIGRELKTEAKKEIKKAEKKEIKKQKEKLKNKLKNKFKGWLK